MKWLRLVAIVGGGLIIGGVWLNWIELFSRDAGTGTPVGETVRGVTGMDIELGVLTLGAGIAIAALALIGLFVRSRVIGLLIVLTAVGATVAAWPAVTDARSAYVDHEVKRQVEQGQTEESARENLESFLEFGAAGVRSGPGLYLVVGGAVVAAIAGLGILAARRPRRARLDETTRTPTRDAIVGERAPVPAASEPAYPPPPSDIPSERPPLDDAQDGDVGGSPGTGSVAEEEHGRAPREPASEDEPDRPHGPSLGDSWSG